MPVHLIYTSAVVVSIAVAALSKIVLLRRPHRDHRLLDDPRDTVLYVLSKFAPVLAVAFAVAADASAGTSAGNAAVGTAGLLVVTGVTVWSVQARLTGRFFGLAHRFQRGR